jgi:hypothetical protein
LQPYHAGGDGASFEPYMQHLPEWGFALSQYLGAGCVGGRWVGWRVGGLVGWWVGGLVGWWVDGLVGWWVGGLVG